jgi:hypothetical protein
MTERNFDARWSTAPNWPLLAVFATLLTVSSARPLQAQEASSADSREQATTEAPASETETVTGLPRGKKLFLADGSFQIVREYSREGDRVRYYSVERSAWEEIPASMVDWAATEKAEAEMAAQQSETLDRLHSSAADDLAMLIDTGSSLQTPSGVILPDAPGFYVLDGKTVLSLEQVQSAARIDKGRAILKAISGIPLISTKHIIEIPGKRSKIRVRSAEPEFYIRTNDGRDPQLTLVRAEINGDKRQVATAVTDMTGITKYENQEIHMMSSEAARGVRRLTMGQTLEPGEYALIESTNEGISSYVWEFGVDPAPRGSEAKREEKPSGR